MPALQVRDLPEDVYAGLKERAAREHRSLSQQTIVGLREYLQMDPEGVKTAVLESRKVSYEDALAGWRHPSDETREERAARKKKLFEEIDKLPKFDLPPGYSSVAEMIREDRDSR